MKNLPKAPTVRMPGLCIDVGQPVNGGSRLSAMAEVTPPANGHPHTLEGSVRGAKPDEDDTRSLTAQPRGPLRRTVRAVLRGGNTE